MSIRRLIGRNAQERAGSVTFNAPAIWTSPNRVVSVNVAGKGGTGNPGNNGIGGNAGYGNRIPCWHGESGR